MHSVNLDTSSMSSAFPTGLDVLMAFSDKKPDPQFSFGLPWTSGVQCILSLSALGCNEEIYIGVSYCSKKDTFNKRFGYVLALRRAIANAHLTGTIVSRAIWTKFNVFYPKGVE